MKLVSVNVREKLHSKVFYQVKDKIVDKTRYFVEFQILYEIEDVVYDNVKNPIWFENHDRILEKYSR